MPRTTHSSFAFMLLFFAAVLPLAAADEKPPAAAPASAPAKPPSLTLTIRSDQTTFKVGDEIRITFRIKNAGDTPHTYVDRNYDRSGRLDEFVLTATDKNGADAPDPRADRHGGIGGGIQGHSTLNPGQFFEKTIPLNRWALIKKSGAYHVTATYLVDGGDSIDSAPLDITILPRSDDEMAQYINSLSAQLQIILDVFKKHPDPTNDHILPDQYTAEESLLQKLAFTCDRRVLPALIDAAYADPIMNSGFWLSEALNYYLPKDDKSTNAALIKAATERGMNMPIFYILKDAACPPEQMKKLIAVSLAPNHPDAWVGGALAAYFYPDDSFTPRLITLATDKKASGRHNAIMALARNRTDESVAALKLLLKEKEPDEFQTQSIADVAASAIRDAYLGVNGTPGRKLRPDDFPPELQREK